MATQAELDAATAPLVPKSLFDANSVLAATADDTPAAVTMAASTILARLASGNIKAASVAEIVALLAVPLAADVPILAPGSSTRNVIQPTAATFIPLVLKGFASQSAAMFQVQDSAAAAKLSIAQNGTITWNATNQTIGSTVGGVISFSGVLDAPSLSISGNSVLDKNGDTNAQVVIGASGTVTAQKLTVVCTQAGKVAIACKANSGQTANIFEIQDSTAALLSGYNKGGYWFTKKVSAPADGDLVASQMMIWFDDTNGAAKLKIKAKEAGGTVRTGEVALA